MPKVTDGPVSWSLGVVEGTESPWCDGITWGLESLDWRSFDDLESRIDLESLDLESLEGLWTLPRFGFSDRQSWAHNRECVYNRQQIVSLGVTLSGAEVDLLLRMSN